MVVKRRYLAFVAAVAMSTGLVIACGSDDKNEDEETSTGGSLSWSTDINPIVTASCGGTDCHGATPAAGRKTYVGSEANFKADAASIKLQLSANIMPKAPGTITSANEKKLVDFLNQ